MQAAVQYVEAISGQRCALGMPWLTYRPETLGTARIPGQDSVSSAVTTPTQVLVHVALTLLH